MKNLEVPGEARNSRSKSVLSERLAFDGTARNVKCKQMDRTVRLSGNRPVNFLSAPGIDEEEGEEDDDDDEG